MKDKELEQLSKTSTPKHLRRYVGYPGDPEHRKWVGCNWDLCGTYQLRLLFAAGLYKHHYLLDIGCGALRGGRFFITYLLPGHYFGIEPEKWVVEEGIKKEVGKDLIDLKRPVFDYNKDANMSVFNRKFDYILAHSVIFHAPKMWVERCFSEVKKVLKPEGKFLANVKFSKENKNIEGIEWHYPSYSLYTRETLGNIIEGVGLKMKITDWQHPMALGQTWILVTHSCGKN